MNHPRFHELRRARRSRRSDAMFWRWSVKDRMEMGWILESSTDGLAFAWRGALAPQKGSIIEVSTNPAAGDETPTPAVVRRNSNPHDDLHILGVELLRQRTFPEEMHSVVEIPLSRHLPSRLVQDLVRSG